MNQKHTLRAVSHPAMLALEGLTVRIEARLAADGGTCLFLLDPNSGTMLAQIGLLDDGAHVRAHCGIRCSAAEQNASYKRASEKTLTAGQVLSKAAGRIAEIDGAN